MKILVTGGAGFIGSHVADALLVDGNEVHVLDDLSSGRKENVPAQATLHEVDVRSPEVANLFASYHFDILVHHAAQMDVRKSVADPRFDADVNVGGLINLMEAGRLHGLKKVVFASTGGAIYGEPEHAPQTESHPLRPVSPYGITKLTGEKYLYFYEHEYGIPSVCLRYGNVYGPRQNPHGEAGVVAIFAEKLITGGQPVIYGDGLQTRDYVYVGDVVKANMLAVRYPGSGTFNVGTAKETNVNELFTIVRDILSPDTPERHAAARPGEQKRSVLDYGHSERDLKWVPTVTLAQGLAETCAWFRRELSDTAANRSD